MPHPRPDSIPDDVDEAAVRFREIFAEEIDPAWGASLFGTARLTDVTAPVPVSPDDILVSMRAAFEAGDVPIGPMAYSRDTPQHDLARGGRLVTLVSGPGDPPDIKAALALGPAGMVVVGATRFGKLTNGEYAPSTYLLSDLEGFIAELMVYAAYRAQQISYVGPVRLDVHLQCRVPNSPVLFRRLDEHTGELLSTGTPGTTDHVEFTFDLAEGWEGLHRRSHEFSVAVAGYFGARTAEFIGPVEGQERIFLEPAAPADQR